MGARMSGTNLTVSLNHSDPFPFKFRFATPDNACVHEPTARRDDGQQTFTNPQTVMREDYAETHARGFGRAANV